MYNYYQGSQDIEIVGRIAMPLFIVTLACDTAFVSLKEIDTYRRAALYRELAEKDLLTIATTGMLTTKIPVELQKTDKSSVVCI